MAYTCGDCKLFEGAGKVCGAGVSNRNPTTTSCLNGFKGPTRLFTGNRCGCCVLFEGPEKKCGGELSGRRSGTAACGSYTPIAG